MIDDAKLNGVVVILDDESSIVSVLKEYLTLKGYTCIAFEAADQFLSWLQADPTILLNPICVLCDVSMPGLTGLQLQQRLACHPEIAMVMMSGAATNQDVVDAFRAGAVDFLLKPLNDTLLFEVLDRSLQTSAEVRKRKLYTARYRELTDTLTERELATLRRVAQGRLNREIASEFGIALRTVKLYRQRGFEKLGIELNVDLIRLHSEGLL